MIPEYTAEGGGGKGSSQRATAKPNSYEPPATCPGLPVWTNELGRQLRLHCGIDRPPQSHEEAFVVMFFGIKQRAPKLIDDLDKAEAGSAERIAALKAIYRHRAQLLHPDKGGHEEAFKVLQVAHSILSRGQG